MTSFNTQTYVCNCLLMFRPYYAVKSGNMHHKNHDLKNSS